MTAKIPIDLTSVQETLLLPLWGRAVETRRAAPRLIDKLAAEIIDAIDYDFSAITKNISYVTRYAWIARSIHFDRTIRAFLKLHCGAALVLVFVITVTSAGGRLRWFNKLDSLRCYSWADPTGDPTRPSGAGGAASSALSLGLDDGTASPAASLLASEAAALGAYVTVITNTST